MEIEQIEFAAAELLAAMKAYPDLVHLKHSIRGELSRIAGHMETDQYLVHWLLCLSTARERYFDDFNPTKDYHRAIVKIHVAIGRAGGNVAVHRTSRFVKFLERLEKDRPAMIFPPETVEGGRARYVERALAGNSPN